MGFVVAVAAVVGLLLLQLELSAFTPVPRGGLRVLMYHRVTRGPGERYAMPLAVLRRQLEWIRARGYRVVSLRQVIESVDGGAPLPARAMLLTFDDGTPDALELLDPLLRELGMRAALFAVPTWVEAARTGTDPGQASLDAAGLRAVASTLEVGLHGYDHRDLARLPPAEVEAELRRSVESLQRQGVPFLPALAYPYGSYPRKDPAARGEFLEAVRRAGMRAAFRIGNRVNPLPLPAPFEIRRTEIQGDEPFWVFRWKVWKGRRKAF